MTIHTLSDEPCSLSTPSCSPSAAALPLPARFKVETTGIGPILTFYVQVGMRDPHPPPLPHSYKCVFGVYSLNFAPTDCHLVLVLHFFFLFFFLQVWAKLNCFNQHVRLQWKLKPASPHGDTSKTPVDHLVWWRSCSVDLPASWLVKLVTRFRCILRQRARTYAFNDTVSGFPPKINVQRKLKLQ